MEASSSPARISSIDLLKGLVMIIMALDHTRDFFHYGHHAGQNPVNFETTNSLLFLTRWITHFCAPVFVFLSGTSIYFMARSRTKKQLSGFLLSRGIWLIIMEFTLVHFGWMMSFEFSRIVFGVIAVIGSCMILMSALIYLPERWLLVVSLILILGHNLLDPYDKWLFERGGLAYSLLHYRHFFHLTEFHKFGMLYPIIPWIGVMVLGFLLGRLYDRGQDPAKRRKRLIQMGFVCLIGFILLRSFNIYGDPEAWSVQKNFAFTLLSFINISKYPPSLHFLLLTLGPALIFLALSESWKGRWLSLPITFGKVPFFYYLLHLYVIHIMTLAFFLLTGNHMEQLNPNRFPGGFPGGFGVYLWQVYLFWFLAIAILYFPCLWYGRYKSKHKKWWLSYL